MAIGRVTDTIMQMPYKESFPLFLQIPSITKIDILEYFEEAILVLSTGPFEKENGIMELDSLFMIYPFETLHSTLFENSPKPTYASEYINIIGQLFLAGYIDFGCDWDDDYDRIDYPTNLSYYKEDKYQAWIYFRDNFFYKRAWDKSDIEDDIYIYEGKEYSYENCPSFYNEKIKSQTLCGYSTMYSPTSWDTPKYWSQYNIWVARTPKGTQYFNEILAPRFYNKYKDLEVEIDEKGNIIQWIGKIHR